jgi:hypothetical protein
MILLQEESQTVSFDPSVICYGGPPWYESLFRLYMLFVLLLLMARIVQISHFRSLWDSTNHRVNSLHSFFVLTFVLVLANVMAGFARIFTTVSFVKRPGVSAVSGAAAEVLLIGALELLVCAALYAAAFFFRTCLARRLRSFEAEKTGPGDLRHFGN